MKHEASTQIRSKTKSKTSWRKGSPVKVEKSLHHEGILGKYAEAHDRRNSQYDFSPFLNLLSFLSLLVGLSLRPRRLVYLTPNFALDASFSPLYLFLFLFWFSHSFTRSMSCSRQASRISSRRSVSLSSFLCLSLNSLFIPRIARGVLFWQPAQTGSRVPIQTRVCNGLSWLQR